MTAPIPPTGRGRLLAVLLLVLVAVGGGIVGAAVDRLCLARHPYGERFGHGWGPGHGRWHGDRFRDRFARELGLTDAQRARIDSIMDRQRSQLEQMRREAQPRLDSIIGRARAAIDSVLTPEQRSKAEELRRRHPRPPRHPDGGFGPPGAGDGLPPGPAPPPRPS